MKFTGLVIAKMNSERVKNKVIRQLRGRHLINYALRTLYESGLDELVLFCSDPAIQNYVESDIDYTFVQRPEWLDTQKITEKELFDTFIEMCEPEYIVAHWCTSPFIRSDTIKELVTAMRTGRHDSANVRVEIPFQHIFCKDEPVNFTFGTGERSQDAEPVHGEVWTRAFHADLHRVHRRRIGFNPYWVTVPLIEAWDIDTEEEWQIAEFIGRLKKRKPPKSFSRKELSKFEPSL